VSPFPPAIPSLTPLLPRRSHRARFRGGEPEYCARRLKHRASAKRLPRQHRILLQHAAELRGGRRGPRATAAETSHGFSSAWLLLTRSRNSQAGAVRARGRASGGGGGCFAWALARERVGQRGNAQLSAPHAELLSEIQSTESGRYRHPQWWIDALRLAYPASGGPSVGVEPTSSHGFAGNRPTTLCEGYLEKLDRAGIPARVLGHDAVLLEKPCRVERLPGFAAGESRCRMPALSERRRFWMFATGCGCWMLRGARWQNGHLLELAQCELLAVDADSVPGRGVSPKSLQTEALGESRGRDCASGGFSVRGGLSTAFFSMRLARHRRGAAPPDIKWLRRKTDVSEFGRTQAELLEALLAGTRPRW